jgi:Protein of unknown function (DUF3263)
MVESTQPARHSTLNHFDADILEFAKRWEPFDGGHEFVLAEFGIDIGEYYRRLTQILERLEPKDRDPRVVAAARRHLALRHGDS